MALNPGDDGHPTLTSRPSPQIPLTRAGVPGPSATLQVPRPIVNTFGPADDADLPDDARLLAQMGFTRRALALALDIAHERGTTAAEELIRLGRLAPYIWWQAVADHLGVTFLRHVRLPARAVDATLPEASHFRRIRQIWYGDRHARTLVVAPLGHEIGRLKQSLDADPALAGRLAIATPGTIRNAFRRSYERAMTDAAIHRIKIDHPDRSAASSAALTLRMLACGLGVIAVAILVPFATLVGLDLIFLIAGGMRLAAALRLKPRQADARLSDADLPSYSVLVPLFREVAIISDLVAALLRLDYPSDRLTIHLLVEADDVETRRAAERAAAGTHIEVIPIPPSQPRTKPKALVWSLPLVDSDLITVFDAEDRPAPDQLRQAAAAFAAGPDDLVCVQATLDIDHTATSSNWLSRQFALEYRVLFRALLPWLARNRLFLPLGGSSNHFRRDALLAVGAWDPYNVTEDADIAARLVRTGGRIVTISSVTREEAPLSLSAWHMQRTRWMKGWLQTWLVHMGQPRSLLKDLGLANFVCFQVLILGQLVSAIVYPVGFGILVADLLGLIPMFTDRSFEGDILLSLQLLALLMGWSGAVAAMLATSGQGNVPVRSRDLLTVPIYWMLLVPAAFNALHELMVAPHHWNKTGHGIAERTEDVSASPP